MLEQLNDWFQMYLHATKDSPLLAAVVIPIVGVLTYTAKSIPANVINFIWRRITVSMTMNNAGWDGNLDAFEAFDKWFMDSNWVSTSRSFFLFRQFRYRTSETEPYRPYRLGIGNGLHIFFYNNRLYWFNKNRLESSGSEKQKEEITVTTFGFSISAFSSLVGILNEREADDNDVSIYRFSDKEAEWSKIVKLVPRDINTVALDSKIKESVISRIQQFTKDKDHYRKKGLTYKISFIFYGPPGTGKTVFTRALSTYFKKDLYELDLNTMTDRGVLAALSKVQPGAILLIEDIDAAGAAVKSREAIKQEGETFIDLKSLTLKGILNAIDGIIGLDNIILIATTNHLEDLDSALTRTSRFDFKHCFDLMTERQIFEYSKLMFERDLTCSFDSAAELGELRRLGKDGTVPLLSGSDVECLYKQHHDDSVAFLKAVVEEIKKPTLRMVAKDIFKHFAPEDVAPKVRSFGVVDTTTA